MKNQDWNKLYKQNLAYSEKETLLWDINGKTKKKNCRN